MIFLILDILFYSLSNFKTCFITLFFNKKNNFLEYIILSTLIILITKKYIYYLIILSVLYILNKYVYKKFIVNKYIILILNFLIFFNLKLNLNCILTFLLIVLFNTFGPYNVMGD